MPRRPAPWRQRVHAQFRRFAQAGLDVAERGRGRSRHFIVTPRENKLYQARDGSVGFCLHRVYGVESFEASDPVQVLARLRRMQDEDRAPGTD